MSFPNCFIKADDCYNTFEKFVPAPYFRKSFTVSEATDADISIAVCGFYRLFINGNEITKGFLAPYISNPEHIVYQDNYSVRLKTGKNVIAVMLGNGFVNNPGGWVWDFNKASFRAAPHFSLRLTCDGITIESDTSFKTAPSPIAFDDYRYGEHYDATREIHGWNLPDFDDSAWKCSVSADMPKGELRVCEAEPIRLYKELKPVKITEVDGGYIYDFGENMSGVCRLDIDAAATQKIELQYGEQIVDGRLDIKRIWFPDNENGTHWQFDSRYVHKDIYICRDGRQSYTPSFTYHGFRYVLVTGVTGAQATEELLTFIVFNSELASCGDFTTSDKTVTSLIEAVKRSVLSNFHYFPTDCPHREKNGWTADAALSAEQTLLKLDASRSYREWLRNICKAQNQAGALPGIIPTGGWGFHWGNGPAWDCALAVIPYFCYKYRGDTQIIRECAPSFIKYLKYLETRRNADGLLEIGLGDWCQAGVRYGGIKAPLAVTDTIMAADIADKISFMLNRIGMSAEGEYAKAESTFYHESFRKRLIDFNSMSVSGDCQTAQAMAIYYNIFTDSEKQAAFDRLLEYIKDADDHIDTGVLGGRVIFHVLSSFGYSDLAYKMIMRPDFPSYAYMINKGFTTVWESFLPEPLDSANHHFWGDVAAWFTKRVAGLDYNPEADCLTRVDIKPHILENLNDASAYYICNCGRIETSWVKTDRAVMLKVSVPDGMIGIIAPQSNYRFADGSTEKPLKSGNYTLLKN